MQVNENPFRSALLFGLNQIAARLVAQVQSFKCPFLKKHGDGTTSCGIYEDRPSQCRLFPLDRRDVQEVRGTCSFYFIEKPIKLEKAS